MRRRGTQWHTFSVLATHFVWLLCDVRLLVVVGARTDGQRLVCEGEGLEKGKHWSAPGRATSRDFRVGARDGRDRGVGDGGSSVVGGQRPAVVTAGVST
jgi:hypothetical protein